MTHNYFLFFFQILDELFWSSPLLFRNVWSCRSTESWILQASRVQQQSPPRSPAACRRAAMNGRTVFAVNRSPVLAWNVEPPQPLPYADMPAAAAAISPVVSPADPYARCWQNQVDAGKCILYLKSCIVSVCYTRTLVTLHLKNGFLFYLNSKQLCKILVHLMAFFIQSSDCYLFNTYTSLQCYKLYT